MVAKGIDINREEREFDYSDGWLYCNNNQLTELVIPEGVTHVYCVFNQITHLTIPDSVEWVSADKEVPGLEVYIGEKIEVQLW